MKKQTILSKVCKVQANQHLYRSCQTSFKTIRFSARETTRLSSWHGVPMSQSGQYDNILARYPVIEAQLREKTITEGSHKIICYTQILC